MSSILKNMLVLVSICCAIAHTTAQNCGDTVPQLDCTSGPFTVCENDFVAVPSLASTSTLPTIEYVVTKSGELANDLLGDRILGSSPSTVFDPSASPFNLAPGESFEVYPVAYNLSAIQNLTEELLNGTFMISVLTLPCCQAIEIVVPSFCTNLNNAGYFNGSDIQNLNDVFALVDLFAAVPGSTFSVPGFLASIDAINTSAGGALPATCGASFVPICYAAPTSGGGICSYSILPSNDVACLPLPLNLVEFKGEALPWSNRLSWTTENNANISNFTIERSSDGIRFYVLDDFAFAPGDETNMFEFIDRQPMLGENYYRLSIRGEEGEIDYSGTIIIDRKDEPVFSIDALAPNPVRDQLIVGIVNDEPGIVRMEIIDINGQVLLNDRLALPAGVSAQEINVGDLTSGIYFVSLRKGNQSDVQKFYKK